MFTHGGGVTVVPIKPGFDPAKDGFIESADWSKRAQIPLRLGVPVDGGRFEDQVLHEGKPLTA